MSVYMTEDEQLESIKNWFKKYGNILTTIVSILLLVIAAYRYYNWHQNNVAQKASANYEQMMLAMSHNNLNSVKSYARNLTQNFKNTVYADVAHLTLAKMYVIKNNLSKAKQELQWVFEKGHDSALRQISMLRLARILLTEKKYDNALKQLNNLHEKTFIAIVNELKGDIFFAKGEFQNANKSYQQAILEAKNSGVGNLFLEMKSNELAMKTHTLTNAKNIQTT